MRHTTNPRLIRLHDKQAAEREAGHDDDDVADDDEPGMESQSAAHEISELIGAIQDETTKAVRVVEEGARKTADGTNVVEQTREAFLSIGQAAEDMAAASSRSPPRPRRSRPPLKSWPRMPTVSTGSSRSSSSRPEAPR